MSRGKYIRLMDAYRMEQLRSRGWKLQAIADDFGVTRQAVHRALRGEGMMEQRRIADRAEYFLGGITGPVEGNSFRKVVDIDGAQSKFDSHAIGVHELTSPDPLDILIAMEDAEHE